MDDPELHGDEEILIRTQAVHVKSISFEAILTNKRIILIDRIKNLLPPKEILLATIKSVESGENAIRDLVITLGVITKSGGTRKMVLTFSREGGGNRIKERDEWVRQIREHLAPSFEQVIRKVIPGMETGEAAQQQARPARATKKAVENAPESWQAPVQAPSPQPESILGTYCTKCGTKVPEGSGFCNKCGNRIILPGESPQAPAMARVAPPASTATRGRPIDQDISSIEPLIERSQVNIPRDPLRSVPPAAAPQAPVVPEQAAAVPPAAPQAKKRFIPRLFSPKDLPPTPLVPSSMPTAVSPPPKKPKSRKKIVLAVGIIVIILIAIVAVVVVLPKMGSLGNILPSSSGSATATATPAPATTTKSSGSTSTAVVAATQTPVSIPQTGVYVYVNYLGGWKGTYGTSGNQVTKTNSGERVMEVENATGIVTASFWKLDSSSHGITVSIYKDGKVLTTGSTSVPSGKVTLSVDTTTGVAQQPVVSGNSGTTPGVTTIPVTNTTAKITTANTTKAATK
jgi:hypothetical protein